MDRAEREKNLHKRIHIHYIERERNRICAAVDRFWFSQMWRLVENYADTKKNLKILDLGAGTCLFFEYLKNFPNIHYTGVDISPEMISYAREKYSKFRNFSAQEANLDGAYTISEAHDVYAFRSIIHHLSKKEEFLKSFFRKIPKGSLVIISEPNRNMLTHGLREWLKKIRPSHFDAEHEDMSQKFFCDIFQAESVKILKIHYFGYLSYPFNFPHILKLPLPMILANIFIFFDKFLSSVPGIRRFSWHTMYAVEK